MWNKVNEADRFHYRPRLAAAALLIVSKYLASLSHDAASFCSTTHLHSGQDNGLQSLRHVPYYLMSAPSMWSPRS